MREIDRWGSEWVRERGRLLKREKERERKIEKQMCQNCMPTMNVHSVIINMVHNVNCFEL